MKENDAGQVQAAVMPLQIIADAGAAVLLAGHSAKTDIGQGHSCRCLEALPAIIDNIVEFHATVLNNGAYNGTNAVRLNDGVYLLVIHADGAWTVSIN